MRPSFLSYKRPDLGGADYGCFAKLPRHTPEIGKGYFRTTYQDDYLKKHEDKKFKPFTGQIFSTTGTYCGIPSNYELINKKYISSKLINEKYNPNTERKYNTEIQRTWIYHRDPAIQGIEEFKIDHATRRPIPKEIKFMTLPMKNQEEYQNIQHQNFVQCGHKISDITRKRLIEMAEIKKQKEGVS